MTDTRPVLGILNDTEAPHESMIVVVFGKPKGLRWAYISAKPFRTNGDHQYIEPHLFTSLKTFGIEATLLPDGRLALHQINISTAKYPDGTPRRWQGSASAAIDVIDAWAGHVMRAVHLDFESRRAERERTMNAAAEPPNASPS